MEKELVRLALNEYSLEGTMYLFKDIEEEVLKNPELFFNNIKHILKDIAESTNCCVECGSELEVIDTYKEDRGEYWGQVCYEDVNIYGCPECGYTVPN